MYSRNVWSLFYEISPANHLISVGSDFIMLVLLQSYKNGGAES